MKNDFQYNKYFEENNVQTVLDKNSVNIFKKNKFTSKRINYKYRRNDNPICSSYLTFNDNLQYKKIPKKKKNKDFQDFHYFPIHRSRKISTHLINVSNINHCKPL